MIHCSGLVAWSLQAFVNMSCPPGACDTSVTISSDLDLRDLPTCALLGYSDETGVLVEAFQSVSYSFLNICSLPWCSRSSEHAGHELNKQRIVTVTESWLSPAQPSGPSSISHDFWRVGFLPSMPWYQWVCLQKQKLFSCSLIVQRCGKVCSFSVWSPRAQSTHLALLLPHLG